MADLGDLIVRIGANITGFTGGMDDVNKQLNAAVSQAEAASRGFERFGAQLTSIGTSMSIGLTAPLVAFGGAALMSAANMQTLQLGLTAVTGSASEASKEFESLKEVAKLPGLGFEESVQGAIRLQAAGLSADQAKQALLAFGNALASVGKGRAELQGVIVQLQQMFNSVNVKASDLRPIIEQVPQVAQILRENLGTIDTEAIQKMGISGQQMVGILVTELGKLPPVTGGIKNDFENMRDSVSQALAKIGEALIPIASTFINTVVPAIEALAQWFGALDPAIQTAIIAIAGIAAAIGPLLIVAGQLITAFGSIAGMIAGAGGITAALTVLGPIVAGIAAAWALWELGSWMATLEPVQTAFGVLRTALSAVWMSLQNLFAALSPILAPIASFVGVVVQLSAVLATGAVVLALNAISLILSGLGLVINTAATAFDWLVKQLGAFLTWAGNLPGVSTVLGGLKTGLDGFKTAMSEAIPKAAEMNTHTDASKTAAEGAKKAFGEWHPQVTKVGEESGKAAVNVASLKEKSELLWAISSQLEASHKAHITALATLSINIEKAKTDTTDWALEANNLLISLTSQGTALDDLATMKIPSYISGIESAKGGVAGLDADLKTLGITSQTEADRMSQSIIDAAARVINDPIATQWEQDNAMLRGLKAIKDEAIRTGDAVPQQIQDMIDEIEKKGKDPAKGIEHAVKGPFDDSFTKVSTSITNFTQAAFKALFEGDGSFGDRMTKAFKNLGAGLMTAMTEPFISGLSDWVNTTFRTALKPITDKMNSIFGGLFGGKGGGGGGTGIPGVDVGSDLGGMTDLIGGGPNYKDITDIPGGAGGAGGGIGGTISGLLGGVLGPIGSIIGAVTGVIGVFQSMHQETSLNAIEHNTRYSMMYLGERADGGICWAALKSAELLSYIHNNTGAGSFIVTDLDDIKGSLWTIKGSMSQPQDDSAILGKWDMQFGKWDMLIQTMWDIKDAIVPALKFGGMLIGELIYWTMKQVEVIQTKVDWMTQQWGGGGGAGGSTAAPGSMDASVIGAELAGVWNAILMTANPTDFIARFGPEKWQEFQNATLPGGLAPKVVNVSFAGANFYGVDSADALIQGVVDAVNERYGAMVPA